MKNLTSLLLIASLTFFLAGNVNAASPNLLTNGSFENTGNTFVPGAQQIMDLGIGSTVIPGWTVGPGVSVGWARDTNPYGLTTPSGNFLLDLTGCCDSGFGSVQQVLSTQVGAVYHLSFDMGANNSCPGFNCSGPMATRVVVAGVQQDFTGFNPAGPGMHWGTFGMDFTAVATNTTVALIGLHVPGGSVQFRGLDNASVQLLTAVPEPDIYAMWLAGLGILGWMAKGRRHRS